MKPYLSCYFYPTTVVCVDDDVTLLRSLRPLLEGNHLVAEFHSPFDAEKFLLEQEKRLSVMQFATGRSFDKSNVELYINKIHELIYDAKRFEEVSTLIVDFYMPGINGLDFCRKFSGSLYQKIMLTGEADQAVAVSAFNDGLINQFVMKGETEAIDKVKDLAQKMQAQFLRDKTKFLVEFLLQLDPVRFNYFVDPGFAEPFQAILNEHAIQEMYLFNQEGVYLLIDQANQLWWLRIRGSRDYQLLQQETKSAYLEDPSPEAEAVYKLVSSKQKFPLFSLLAEQLVHMEDWEEILVDPIEIKTAQDTYQVLLGQDIGRSALRYQDIKFLDF